MTTDTQGSTKQMCQLWSYMLRSEPKNSAPSIRCCQRRRTRAHLYMCCGILLRWVTKLLQPSWKWCSTDQMLHNDKCVSTPRVCTFCFIVFFKMWFSWFHIASKRVHQTVTRLSQVLVGATNALINFSVLHFPKCFLTLTVLQCYSSFYDIIMTESADGDAATARTSAQMSYTYMGICLFCRSNYCFPEGIADFNAVLWKPFWLILLFQFM